LVEVVLDRGRIPRRRASQARHLVSGRNGYEDDFRLGHQLDSLEHVLWIGGAPASGKTTVATRIARRHGLRWYGADTRTWEHRDRAIRAGNAAAIRWEATTPVERAETRPPAELLELSLHSERGPMVVDDLHALPRSPLVVADGTTLPAAAVQDRSRAAWLIPTPEFQRARLEERVVSRGTRDLYRALAETIEGEARAVGVPIVVVDGSEGVAASVDAVERLFADALAAGPLAETLHQRQALLREANQAIVAQVRGYFARPWASGDPDAVVRAFLCECGDTSCELEVEARVEVAAASPLLAPGHG
jgi:hypothetical protein